MGSNLPKHVRCFFAYAKTLPRGTFASLTDDARDELTRLVEEAIENTMAEHPKARISTIVKLVDEEVQAEADEIIIRDQDEQHIEKIIDAAIARFPSIYDLRNPDEDTLAKIERVVRKHMEKVAYDWCLTACTSLRLVMDDLIDAASYRARRQVEALLAGEELDEDDEDDEEDEEDWD